MYIYLVLFDGLKILNMVGFEFILSFLDFDNEMNFHLKHLKWIFNDNRFHFHVSALVLVTFALLNFASTKVNFIIFWSGNFFLFLFFLFYFFMLNIFLLLRNWKFRRVVLFPFNWSETTDSFVLILIWCLKFLIWTGKWQLLFWLNLLNTFLDFRP